MNVECTSCSTSFPVDPKKVPAGGVHARCSVCDEVFFVDEPVLEAEAALVETFPEAPVEFSDPVMEEAESVYEVPEPVMDEPEPAFEAPEPVMDEPEPAFEAPAPTWEVPAEEPAPSFVADAETAFDTPMPEFEDTALVDEPVEAAEATPEPLAEAPTFGEPEPTFDEPERSWEEGEPTFGEGEPTFDMGAPAFDEPEAPSFGAPMEETQAFEAPPPAAEPTPTPLPTPTFGRRDPKEKAQRLARVLVSDIILYNPDRHQRALNENRIQEEFDDEIQKSWSEYVEQVGDEIANGNNFFNEALNEILAKGQQMF